MMVVIVIAIFSGFFIFYQESMSDAGRSIEGSYSALYANLSENQKEVDVKVLAVKTAVTDIQETTSTLDTGLSAAKGAYRALLLIPTFLSTALSTFFDIAYSLDFIPGWAITAIITSITILLIFLVLKTVLGRTDL